MTAVEELAAGEVLHIALELAGAGYALTPVRMGVDAAGRKRPHPCLKGWKASTDPDQIRDWYAQFAPNVWAQVCAPSGVDVVDLDAKAGGPANYLAAGLPDSTMVVDTPGGGLHYVFAADPDRPLGVTAGRLAGVDTRSAGSDTKGGISFIVGVLPDGRWWRPRAVVPVAALPATPEALRPLFAGLARTERVRDTSGTRESSVFAAPSRTFTRSQALKLWNDQLADIEAIAHLQGARHTTLVKVSRALGIFDGAVPGIMEATWGRLRLTLEGQPGVDIARAARTFQEMWACATDRAVVIDDPPADPFGAAEQTATEAPADTSDIYPDLSQWLDEEYEPPRPEVGLERDDGVRLLYAGKWHTLIAEAGIGKSWLALWHCVEEIRRGHHVVYAHFEESSPRPTLNRLKALGVSATEIRERFHWLDATGRPSSARLGEAAPWGAPTLVILDGINAACGLLGVSPLDVEGVNAYRTRFVAPYTAQGAAVLSLGHPPKARGRQEERHSYGSTAWLDLVDGAAFRLKPSTRPIGRGRDGYTTVYVVKDREGGVEELGAAETVSEEGAWTYLGAFHLMPPQSVLGNTWGRMSTPTRSEAGGATDAELELTDDERKFRWLATQGVPVSASVRTIARSLREAPKGSVGGTQASVVDALLRDRYGQWWTAAGEAWFEASRNKFSVDLVSRTNGTRDTDGTQDQRDVDPPWSDDIFGRLV